MASQAGGPNLTGSRLDLGPGTALLIGWGPDLWKVLLASKLRARLMPRVFCVGPEGIAIQVERGMKMTM